VGKLGERERESHFVEREKERGERKNIND